MIEKYYNIKDVKAGSYIRMFPAVNDDIAVRNFKSLVKTPDTEPNLYPEDFELWAIGEFDNKTAIFNPEVKFIMTGIEAKESN